MDQNSAPGGEESRPPRSLPVSSERSDLRYELVADSIDSNPTASVPAAQGAIDTPDADHSRPVYRRVPGGGVVVPTGRVLVRFSEGDLAASHEDALRSAGYEVDQVLAYATHTAWVRAAAGGVSASLQGLGRLTEVPGVVAVEPQMIGQSAQR